MNDSGLVAVDTGFETGGATRIGLTDGTTLLLEIKGEERERDRAKHQAARRWVSAVNYWGQLGRWAFHACQDPQRVIDEIHHLRR